MEHAVQYPRHLEGAVAEALADTPVVVLQGARQVGKSTLARMVAEGVPNVRQVTLDDPETLSVAHADPTFFVEQAGDGLLIIDEAQRAPGLVLPLKAAVDRNRRPGRFLLTGSADLLQIKGVGDSLAGRAETIELHPLSQGEIAGRGTPEDFVSWVLDRPRGDFAPLDPATVVAGGYPEPIGRTPDRARRWFDSYTARLADHDARDLQQGGYAQHLRQLLGLLAAGGRQEPVRARLARELDVAEATVDSYLRLAATMRLTSTTPAWGRSYRGRAVRRPKISLNDTGLAAALAGFTVDHAMQIGGREYYGTLIEQFVALELEKQRAWSTVRYSLHHFRDPDGLEVDIVAELGDGRLLAIEVKTAASVGAGAWRGLKRFRERFADREVVGVCLHGGSQVATIKGWLHVLPVTALWGC